MRLFKQAWIYIYMHGNCAVFHFFPLVLYGVRRYRTIINSIKRKFLGLWIILWIILGNYIYFYITCRDIILYDKFNSYGLNIFKHIRNDNVLIFCYVKFILSLTKVRWFYLNFQAGKTFNISLSCFIFIFIWTL